MRRTMLAAYIPDGDLAGTPPVCRQACRKDFTGTMKLLRDPSLPGSAGELPAAPRTFLVAYETQDTVTSDWLVRDADGKEYKPEDYLAHSPGSSRRTPSTIDAIRILLDRPQDWNVAALGRAAAEAGAQRRSASPPSTCRRPTRSTITRPWWTSSAWSSMPARSSSPC